MPTSSDPRSGSSADQPAARSRASRRTVRGCRQLSPPPPAVTVVASRADHGRPGTASTPAARDRNPPAAVASGSSAGAAPFNSLDPNSLLGPSGYGPSNFVSRAAKACSRTRSTSRTRPRRPLRPAGGRSPNTLDPNLDLSTFQLTDDRLRRHVLDDPARQPGLPDHRADDLQRRDVRRGHQRRASTIATRQVDRHVPVDRSRHVSCRPTS